ncbi:MAG: hypothetical protein GX352_08560 [Clostridiales bacterium]|nr:hypothetical protein [Clostridiales bacterium]
MTIEDAAHSLYDFPAQKWIPYAFSAGAYAGKIKKEDKYKFFSGATECGNNIARKLLCKYPSYTVKDFIISEGARIINDDIKTESLGIFATYTEPDEIRIAKGVADAADEAIEKAGLSYITGGIKIRDVLYAHELYHHLERKDKSLYTVQKHFLLFRIGTWEYRSQIRCLSEIGAMAFAQKLTGLACSPYILDMFLLYVIRPEQAIQFYNRVMKICGEDEPCT